MLVLRQKLHDGVLRFFAFMIKPFTVYQLAQTHGHLIIQIQLLIIGLILLESLIAAERSRLLQGNICRIVHAILTPEAHDLRILDVDRTGDHPV